MKNRGHQKRGAKRQAMLDEIGQEEIGIKHAHDGVVIFKVEGYRRRSKVVGNRDLGPEVDLQSVKPRIAEPIDLLWRAGGAVSR